MAQPPHLQGMPGRRPVQARAGGAQLDAGAVGRGELGLAAGDRGRAFAQEPDRAGRRSMRLVSAAAFEPEAHAMAGQYRHGGVVGGKDRLEAQAQGLAEEGQILAEVAARQPELGPYRAAARDVDRRFAIPAA